MRVARKINLSSLILLATLLEKLHRVINVYSACLAMLSSCCKFQQRLKLRVTRIGMVRWLAWALVGLFRKIGLNRPH